jgi:hypothetical protein
LSSVFIVPNGKTSFNDGFHARIRSNFRIDDFLERVGGAPFHSSSGHWLLSLTLGAIANIAELSWPFDEAPLGALTLLGRQRRIDHTIHLFLGEFGSPGRFPTV